MNLMFELSVQEAKPLPDFTGTDDFFVSVTLNGLILDKAMLSVINRISERGAELLSTEDFLVIDALYHERPLNEKMQSRLNRLIEMGIVEHIGRKKYVLAQKSLCSDGQNRCAYKTRRLGSRYQQGTAAKAHPPEQRSWYSVQRIAASFAKPESQSNTKTVAGIAHSRKSNKCWKYKRCSMVYYKIVPWKSCL